MFRKHHHLNIYFLLSYNVATHFNDNAFTKIVDHKPIKSKDIFLHTMMWFLTIVPTKCPYLYGSHTYGEENICQGSSLTWLTHTEVERKWSTFHGRYLSCFFFGQNILITIDSSMMAIFCLWYPLKIGQHLLMRWLGAQHVTSQYLKQWWPN